MKPFAWRAAKPPFTYNGLSVLAPPWPLRRWLIGLALVLLGASPQLVAQPIIDDFNDGNDTGWTHYDPISVVVPPGPFAHYSFPSGAYRIRADASPAPEQVGPGRAAALRVQTTYTDFYVAADLLAWDTNLDQAMGLLARISTPGPGTTTGYAFTYQEQDHDFSIAKIVAEVGGDISGSSKPLTLDPAKQYRLVFIGRGANLEGRVYELPNTRTPIAITTAIEATYPSGIAGLLVYDNSTTEDATGDATFDNYFSLFVEPPLLDLTPIEFGDMRVSWSADITGFDLQLSPILPGTNWISIPPEQIHTLNNRFYYDLTPIGNSFFRLVRP